MWKDVDGVLTSDPRIVDGATPVPQLTFEEATELAFFGATVLHPQAMQPAWENGSMGVRVKNSYNRWVGGLVSAWAVAGWFMVPKQSHKLQGCGQR